MGQFETYYCTTARGRVFESQYLTWWQCWQFFMPYPWAWGAVPIGATAYGGEMGGGGGTFWKGLSEYTGDCLRIKI